MCLLSSPAIHKAAILCVGVTKFMRLQQLASLFSLAWCALQTGSHTSQKKLAVAIDDGKDTEDRMEEALVGFLSSLKRPAHLGQDVGPFLIERFGQSCRVGFSDWAAFSFCATYC